MQLAAHHFYWRAGFGPTPSMLFAVKKFSPTNYFDAFWHASKPLPFPLKVSKNIVDGLANGVGALGQMQAATEEERKKMRRQNQQQSRQEIRNLNLLWLQEMIDSPAQLREKIALFWHGHFACRNLNSFFQQQLLQIIRDGALGSFANLLQEVSKSAAMLAFLNNQQNKKQSPNENFARELMELFTLGRGHYTEQDVKESARAFTGWGFGLGGEFVFRKQWHDGGSKTIFGKTGHFTGDDVIDMLLQNPQTATFITTKLYRFLVNEEPDTAKIASLSKSFYDSGYDMQNLLRGIFTASWFYEEKNHGAIVKSPVMLWVGIRRLLPMELENPTIQLLLQNALGQVLFFPPSVAGWSGGTNWIDSSSLLLRMRLPQLVSMAEPFDLQTKIDDDVNMGNMEGMMGKQLPNRFRLKGQIVWEQLDEAFTQVETLAIPATMLRTLLRTNHLPDVGIVKKMSPSADRKAQIQGSAMAVMSFPEYQLC